MNLVHMRTVVIQMPGRPDVVYHVPWPRSFVLIVRSPRYGVEAELSLVPLAVWCGIVLLAWLL